MRVLFPRNVDVQHELTFGMACAVIVVAHLPGGRRYAASGGTSCKCCSRKDRYERPTDVCHGTLLPDPLGSSRRSVSCRRAPLPLWLVPGPRDIVLGPDSAMWFTEFN